MEEDMLRARVPQAAPDGGPERVLSATAMGLSVAQNRRPGRMTADIDGVLVRDS